jgi:hypothetical protein
MIFRKTILLAYSAAALAFGAIQPAAAQQRTPVREEHFPDRIEIAFDDNGKETTYQCGYIVEKGKIIPYLATSGTVIRDKAARTLMVSKAQETTPSLMMVADYDPSKPKQKATHYVVQADESFAARECTHDFKQDTDESCRPVKANIKQQTVDETVVHGMHVCYKHITQPGFSLKTANGKTSSFEERRQIIGANKAKLRGMGFNVN